MSPFHLSAACCTCLLLVVLGAGPAVAQDGELLQAALGFATQVAQGVAQELAEGQDSDNGGQQGSGQRVRLLEPPSPSPSPKPPPPPTQYYDVSSEGYVPANNAGSESPIGAREIWDSLTNTFIGGVEQLVQLRPACSTGSIGIFTGCADQFAVLVAEFGYPLFYPKVTPEKFTPEFYGKVPVPDRESACCLSARLFQGMQCACDVDTIKAMRDLGLFDPEMTVKFADFLYGDLCGANTFLATDCPNGSPFEKLRGRK